MRIEEVQVSDIVTAPYNPRKDLQPGDPEYTAIEQSIDRWDLVEPLIWNTRTKNLVSGHQRLKILIARGKTSVPVSVVDLDLTEEKALSVALNKVQGQWDDYKLVDLLKGLDQVGIDLGLMGFSPDELVELSKDTTRPLFVPVLEPTVPESVLETSTVTSKEIKAAEAKRDVKFAGAARELTDVTCPACGHDFGIEV